MDIQTMWKQANSLRGCLAGIKTIESRRRDAVFHDDGFLEVSSFVRDRVVLSSSKHVRVLPRRPQVFIHPDNFFVRTRLTHTLEVVAFVCILCDMLGLNRDLAEVAALGHDIGHVPCGHQGEAWLAKTMGKSFCHEVMGAVIVQKITRMGRGLNLTWHTLHAMAAHNGKTFNYEMSPEAWVVYWADKFAYIFGDINDIGGRMNYPLGQEITSILDSFGSTYRERTSTVAASLIIESAECGRVSFSQSEIAQKFERLRQLMHNVYIAVTEQNVDDILAPVLEFLQRLNIGDPFLLLALMTDEDVIGLARAKMKSMDDFNKTAAGQIFSTLAGLGKIDLCDVSLDW